MHATVTAPPTDQRSGALAAGRLRVWDIVFFVMSAAAPLTVVVSSAPLAFALGGIGAPGSMIVAAIVLILFSVGFTAMSTHVRNAGAFYAYVGRGLGKPAGVGIAFVTVFAYTMLGISFYALFGFFAQSSFASMLGIDLPWWVWAIAGVIIVGLLGVRRIDVGARVLAVLLTAEVAILLLISIAVLVNGGPEPASAEPFSPAAVFAGPGVAALIVLAFGAFMGFEGTAIYAEEAKDPQRTIPRATYIAVGFLGVFYAFTFWILTLAFGVNGIMDFANSDSWAFMTETTARDYLGSWAEIIVQVLIVTSFFACMLAFHNAASRYVFSLGRERVLPAIVGRTGATTKAPWVASLVMSAIALIAMVLSALFQVDPYVGLGFLVYGIGVEGVIFAQAVAAIAVVAFFARNRRGHSFWRVLVAPTLGALGLAIAFIVIVTNFDIITDAGPEVNFWLLITVPVFFIGGIVTGLVIRVRSPKMYSTLTQSIDIVDAPAGGR